MAEPGVYWAPPVNSLVLWDAIVNARDLGNVEIAVGHPGKVGFGFYLMKHVRVTSLEYVADQFGATPSENVGLGFEEICVVVHVDNQVVQTCYNLLTNTTSSGAPEPESNSAASLQEAQAMPREAPTAPPAARSPAKESPVAPMDRPHGRLDDLPR